MINLFQPCVSLALASFSYFDVLCEVDNMKSIQTKSKLANRDFAQSYVYGYFYV